MCLFSSFRQYIAVINAGPVQASFIAQQTERAIIVWFSVNVHADDFNDRYSYRGLADFRKCVAMNFRVPFTYNDVYRLT